MDPILLALLMVACVIIVITIFLVIASICVHKPINPYVEQILDILPGANCDSCGCGGCRAYAHSIVEEENSITRCGPGGLDCITAISTIMSQADAVADSDKAMVACNGVCGKTKKPTDFESEVRTCQGVKSLEGQEGSEGICRFGCYGLGDCVSLCPEEAISIIDGIAYVDREECVGCGACLDVCPTGLITLIPEHRKKPVVMCHSTDKPMDVLKLCKNGCIGCQKCKKVCPQNAIDVTHFRAKIDQSKCIACHACLKECPQRIIIVPETY